MNGSGLLCEGCGYLIEGLDASSPCPECGRPAGESFPQARPGTRWQRKPGLTAWAVTNWRILRGPTRTFGQISLWGRRGTGLLIANLLVAASIVVLPWTGVLVGSWALKARGDGPVIESAWLLAGFAAQTGLVASILAALTGLEWFGIQALSRVLGWRLTRRAAWEVCCHASIGWLFVGLLPLLALAAWYTLNTLLKVQVTGQVPSHSAGLRTSWETALSLAVPAAGFILGLVIFELLAFIGARRCRFANPAASPPSIA